jgi:hypothetical protein
MTHDILQLDESADQLSDAAELASVERSGVSLLDLPSRGACRWPLLCEDGEALRFCGEQALRALFRGERGDEGRTLSYCAQHPAIAYHSGFIPNGYKSVT